VVTPFLSFEAMPCWIALMLVGAPITTDLCSPKRAKHTSRLPCHSVSHQQGEGANPGAASA